MLLQSALGAIDLPVERLGYTYIVCASGGSLSIDNFVGEVEQRQSVTSDLRRLSRTFVYSTVATSTVDAGVVKRCGSVIEMNVCRCFNMKRLFCSVWFCPHPLPQR